MKDLDMELRSVLGEMASEVRPLRSLTIRHKRRIVLGRSIRVALAATVAVASVATGLSVAGSLGRTESPVRVGGAPEAGHESNGDAAPVASGVMDGGTGWEMSAYAQTDRLCVQMTFDGGDTGETAGNCTAYPRDSVIDYQIARDTTGQPILYGSITNDAGNLALEIEEQSGSTQQPVRLYNPPQSVDVSVRFFAVPSAAANSVALVAYSNGHAIERAPLEWTQRDNDPTPGWSEDSFVMQSEWDGHPYVVRMYGMGEGTCLEVEIDRSTDDSPATCSLDIERHYMDYTEDAIAGRNHVMVFGAVTKDVASIRLNVNGKGTFSTSVTPTGKSLNYFELFVDNDGQLLHGTVEAVDADGTTLETGELCPRHVWGRNGGSLCE